MKKRVLVFAVLILLVLFSYIYFQITDFSVFKQKNEKVTGTGETITGNATSATASLTITINAPPTIDIIKPENETYFNNISMDLHFSSGGADFIWYNIDNGANTTITGNTTFNTTTGQHTLRLYANNSNSTVSDNVTFTVNLTRFTILYSNYKNNGSSTDFNKSSYEDIQNLSGIVLERTNHGKISFNQAINLTNDSTPSDNLLDLDSYTNISFNNITINATTIPNFNKSATLSLYNLTFTNPRILKDGAVCSSTICTQISYSAGVLVFNVTQITSYSAEETPVEGGEEVPAVPGVGGGVPTGFTLSEDEIKVSLKQGQVTTREIKVTNLLNRGLSFEIENMLEDFVIINEKSFYLNRKESKIITVDIFASETSVPNIYTGKLIFKAGGVEKEVSIIVEIESSGALFDVKSEILPGFLYVLPGEDAKAKIKIFNLGGSANVLVEYSILDKSGRIISNETETMYIEKEANFVKSLKIPENVSYDEYIFYTRVTYNQKVASASSLFNVGKSPKKPDYTLLILILLIIIILKSKKIKEYMRRLAERLMLKLNV